MPQKWLGEIPVSQLSKYLFLALIDKGLEHSILPLLLLPESSGDLIDKPSKQPSTLSRESTQHNTYEFLNGPIDG